MNVRAAFDLALDPRDRGRRLRGAFLRPPIAVLRTSLATEVPDVVAAAEAAALAGHWVVGGLAYEAGGVWDASQRTHSGGELARFEVFEGDPEEWPDTPAPADPDWFPAGRFRTPGAPGTVPSVPGPDGVDTPGTPGMAPVSVPDSALTSWDTRNRPWCPGPASTIEAVQAHIAAGDCYQVNLTSRFRTVVAGDFDLYAWFRALSGRQPGGYAVFLRGAGVASVSPELFFHAHPDGRLVTQPMKGTADAATPPERLRENPKDRAENLMIVDLLRNDLGRVCRPGTVRVNALFELIELPTVWQLVSTVTGVRRPGAGLSDTFAALFPCGSVTGAPKIRAMQLIAELEGRPRGWYCGALGVILPGGEAIFNVPIRTVERRGNYLEYGVGSGIVADSRPSAELAEWRAKARFLGGEPFAALETLLLVEGAHPRTEDPSTPRQARGEPSSGTVQSCYPRLDDHLRRLARADAELGLGVDLTEARRVLEQVRDEIPGRARDDGAGMGRGSTADNGGGTSQAGTTDNGSGAGRAAMAIPPDHTWRVRLTARAGDVRVTVAPVGGFPVPIPLALANEPLDVAALRPVIAHKTTWRSHYDALRDRRPEGAFDVICHTPEGLVTEATLGNLAFRLGGRWVTPPASLGLLPGVEREARLSGGTLIEAEIRLEDLTRVSGIAFLNAVRGWVPAVLLHPHDG